MALSRSGLLPRCLAVPRTLARPTTLLSSPALPLTSSSSSSGLPSLASQRRPFSCSASQSVRVRSSQVSENGTGRWTATGEADLCALLPPASHVRQAVPFGLRVRRPLHPVVLLRESLTNLSIDSVTIAQLSAEPAATESPPSAESSSPAPSVSSPTASTAPPTYPSLPPISPLPRVPKPATVSLLPPEVHAARVAANRSRRVLAREEKLSRMTPKEKERYLARQDEAYRISKLTPEEREAEARQRWEAVPSEERPAYERRLREGRERREKGWEKLKGRRKSARADTEWWSGAQADGDSKGY